MPDQENGTRCSITGSPIRKLGSRRKMLEGEADGMSTNIGPVGTEGLEKYDEAVRAVRGQTHFVIHKLVRDEVFGYVSKRFQRILFERGFSAIPLTDSISNLSQ